MNTWAQVLSSEESPEQIILPSSAIEEDEDTVVVPEELPILALRNTVLFPEVMLPITVGREASIKLVRQVAKENNLVGVISQRERKMDEPEPSDLYEVGTVAKILKLLKMPDGSKSIIIQGKKRFKVDEFTQSKPYFKARIEVLDEEGGIDNDVEERALMHSIKESACEMVNLSPNLPNEAIEAIENIDSFPFLIHFIASNLQIDVQEKQLLLETVSLGERGRLLIEHLSKEIQILQLSDELRSRMKSDVNQQQREFFLRQQMKIIQNELGEGNESNEHDALRARAEEKQLPEHATKTFDKEMKKLERTNPSLPDYAVTRNYIDWILDLPWTEFTEDQLDIERAEKILDEDHHGLEKVKKRIIEYLAVLKLKGDMKAPILCFYGPPGVGKTSLGKSIARALDRKFVRMSLGGVHDEAEIRGHRRTYIGALPGRILQGLKKAGSVNPVFMLDEIDKVGDRHRGDPSSALLEVLDPEQNNAFNDHYLELDYDLSKVLFIATANSLQTIPAALRDRMEVINISGYTQEEKLAIAQGYLIPRQVERNGLDETQFTIDDAAVYSIIDGYTRESGVRNLERTIGGVARGVAKKVATKEVKSLNIEKDDIEEYLGARKFFNEIAERTEVPGVATGLAWTPTGGEILFVEASISRGTGKLTLTGSLGDIMQESAKAALSYVKARAEELEIPQSAFKYYDVHVHVPAGAVSKDGPSAGVALLSALVSIYSQRKVNHDLAMTGEITLRGLVLPVGGIKEKVLAAKRAGIKHVLLPDKNENDIKDIKSDLLEGLDISYVRRMSQVLDVTLSDTQIQDPSEIFSTPSPSNGIAQEPTAP
ncbi:MAG: endopeptidase La [Rhodothermaceae bacterium]|nr:endopeptidase La [Rhodothermaceae bacterium]MXZ56872.1 endopeptidase La [Rhodothermaceae bacterium]MYB91419.1 endopeptidase La [Rhodothermaceae bacterium]MYD67879.1 endopeptidase La [Rhodothermaceae bacterium]MYG43530.1 endopeptidase La [Rhodothermaceae bacterium]